ncbi:MAG: hypothetical protein ACD_5C00227G0002 [uncultured bacterium]|nr:MAG: hypothetical protein ACD_5C00227G0002 [uncultured bacterium]
MKKIFIISLVFLLIILLFLGVYNFAFKKENPKNSVMQEQGSQLKKDVIQDSSNLKIEKIISISEEGVVASTYDKKLDSIIYYSAVDGTVWKSNPDGKNKQQVSKDKVMGLKNVIWSPDKSKVLTTINSQGQDKFYQYDNVAQKATPLKEGLDNAIWDNIGSKIFYKYFDKSTNQRTLNIANPDGSEWKKLVDINFRNILLAQIPLSASVSFWNYPAAAEEGILQAVGIMGEESRVVFKGRYGADYLWSPDGSLALISSLDVKNGKKLTIGVIDIDGNYTDLNVPTFASKCVWSSDNKTVYYALASGIPESAVIPDDYLSGKINTKDTFWKMDITTGKKERILDLDDITEALDATGMFLSPTEDSLYFINKSNKKLYKIEL